MSGDTITIPVEQYEKLLNTMERAIAGYSKCARTLEELALFCVDIKKVVEYNEANPQTDITVERAAFINGGHEATSLLVQNIALILAYK